MERAASGQLADHRGVWDRKPVLRLVYEDFYDRVAAACRAGRTIEIGGGIGNLKRRLTDVVATDIQSAPWLDCVADAQRLPFADACAANIVMVDVLHHLEFPLVFFREAARVLRPGGRVLMVEPTLIATRDRDRFHRLCPTLRIAGVQWFALAAYPLSGGFQPWSLIGESIARRLIRIERGLEPALGRFVAFRMLLTVEKAADAER